MRLIFVISFIVIVIFFLDFVIPIPFSSLMAEVFCTNVPNFSKGSGLKVFPVLSANFLEIKRTRCNTSSNTFHHIKHAVLKGINSCGKHVPIYVGKSSPEVSESSSKESGSAKQIVVSNKKYSSTSSKKKADT